MNSQAGKLVITVYSDDSTVRQSVIAALGKQLDKQLAPHEIKEFATDYRKSSR